MPPMASTRPKSSSHVVAGLAIRRNRAGLARACTVRLCSSNQPLRHLVGDRGRVAAIFGTLSPDLLEAHGDALNAAANKRGVPITEVLGAHVDDPAGVDHIIRSVENAALMQPFAVLGLRELIVRA